MTIDRTIESQLTGIQNALIMVQQEAAIMSRLLKDAHRLLNDDLEKLSWRDDVKDWTRAAKPFVQS